MSIAIMSVQPASFNMPLAPNNSSRLDTRRDTDETRPKLHDAADKSGRPQTQNEFTRDQRVPSLARTVSEHYHPTSSTENILGGLQAAVLEGLPNEDARNTGEDGAASLWASLSSEVQQALQDIAGEFSLGLSKTRLRIPEPCSLQPLSCGICMCDMQEGEGFSSESWHPCTDSSCCAAFCGGCQNEYYTTCVNKGRYSCQALRCPDGECEAVIPMRTWSQHVDPSLVELYAKNACSLLTIRCESCDEQYSLLHEQDFWDGGESRPVDEVEDELREQKGAETLQLLKQFLDRETSATEMVAHLVKSFGDDECDEMLIVAKYGDTPVVLERLNDVERRAALQLEYLRQRPFIVTPCCAQDFCFRCKCTGHHEGVTCDEVAQAEIGDGEVQCCPACGVPTVKVEACDHIICVCGQNWNWENGEMFRDDY